MATIKVLPKAQLNILDSDEANQFDLESETYEASLIMNTYIYDDTDETLTDIDMITNEFDAVGYARETLTNNAVTEISGTGIKFDADDVTWTLLAAGSNDIKYAIISVVGTEQLLCIVDFEDDYTPVGANFTIEWNSNGIFTTS